MTILQRDDGEDAPHAALFDHSVALHRRLRAVRSAGANTPVRPVLWSAMATRERDATAERIYATVDAIPRGNVATYGQIASEAGLPRRARLVGRLLRDLPVGSKIPWYRVLNAQGRISSRGAPQSERTQRRRLEREGVTFDERDRVDLRRYAWRPD